MILAICINMHISQILCAEKKNIYIYTVCFGPPLSKYTVASSSLLLFRRQKIRLIVLGAKVMDRQFKFVQHLGPRLWHVRYCSWFGCWCYSFVFFAFFSLQIGGRYWPNFEEYIFFENVTRHDKKPGLKYITECHNCNIAHMVCGVLNNGIVVWFVCFRDYWIC